jgi:LuxR family maltose regulon positive regulatory protein
MHSALLSAKLSPPLISRFSVERELICQRVFAAFDARVVLVHGPAGFGKTTVLAQLLERYRQEGTQVAWLTLDEADNDLPRFVAWLTQALRAAWVPDEEMIDEPGLAALLSRCDGPFALFLDEMELIRDSGVLALVRQLITLLPANARLLIGSRSQPEIGLGRLRARGELLEIMPAQLRFSDQEAEQFLRQRRQLTLRPEQVQSLLNRTEGWPAALWLASVAIEQRGDAGPFIAGFAGTDAAISDWLAEDVLARQPDEVRDFLLATSIPAQLDAALCDALCERDDSAAMLERLLRDHLFLSRVDEPRQQYRYHSLFRSFLRAQLRLEGGGRESALQRRAARWYLAQQRVIPAIDHALEGGDLDFALPLLEQHAESLLGQGRLRLLTRWLEQLPGAELARHPYLRLIHIWAVNLSRGPREALTLLERIDPATLSEAQLAQYHALQPTLLGMRDHIDESQALGRERMRQIAPHFGFPYAMLSQTLAHESMILGDFAAARGYADQARSVQSGAFSRLHAGLAGAVNGAIDLMQGRLRQALAELRLATGVGEGDLIRGVTRHLLPGVLLAEALFESGRWQQAEGLFNLFAPMSQSLGLPDQLIIAHTTLARMASCQEGVEQALELLVQLESLGHQLDLRRVVASARIERAHLLLDTGDAAGAREQLQQAGEAAWWQGVESRFFIANDKLTLAIGQLRWRLRNGEAAQVLAPLKQALAEVERGQRLRRALKLQLLLAEALARDGQHKPAMRTLKRALEHAAPEGFVGTVLEEGPHLQEMVQTLQVQTRQGEVEAVGLDRFLTALVRREEKPPPAAAGLAEALSRKELQVLELVGQGLTNDAMAARLFISESTVRTHLRNINTKLHASNRMHAVAIARQHHLLP